MWNFTLQSASNASNLRVNHKEQWWRTSRLPTHYSWYIWTILQLKWPKGGKDVHMLIITDHFMRYAQALMTSSQNAKCTAWALWDWFVVPYALQESIISDQGQNFDCDLISELCKLAKVQKLHTSPYHPQTNGQYKWFNHTLINVLGTLPPNKKSSWRYMVPMLVHAYNCMRNTATGFSPYYLMYGWKPHLPVDLYFGTQKADMNAATRTKFVQLCERLKWAHKTAQNVIKKENQRHKCNYDHKIRYILFQMSDKVPLKRMAFQGKHKIQDCWEGTVYHFEG